MGSVAKTLTEETLLNITKTCENKMKNFSNSLKNSLDFGDIRKDVIVPFKGQKYHDEISRLQRESRRTGRKVLFEDKEFPPNSTSIGPLDNLNQQLVNTNNRRRSAGL